MGAGDPDAFGMMPLRATFLLGPPGCGKTSLLKARSGNLDKSLKVGGEVSYNGYKLEEFEPQKTSAYISQYDLHIPEMTVRETLDFAACCQGVGSRSEIMIEVSRREKQAAIVPDPDIDTYMKVINEHIKESSLAKLNFSVGTSEIKVRVLDNITVVHWNTRFSSIVGHIWKDKNEEIFSNLNHQPEKLPNKAGNLP
ncbi:hypothetical protein F0562_035425 [Nyssa sinensis]|uniref:ABC transporter domain-containing protein n=1 Tax=Nyssa sinensis TaxID=561372 RepID=A0A5J5AD66_9ASTE|nr:hypothetical protein F0562_035425 [Nyssa sinensis]